MNFWRPYLWRTLNGFHTIKLVQETVLVATGATLPHVYFPHGGTIAVALNDAIVQLSGTASVLDIAQLRRAAEQSVTFRTTLIRHEQALLAQAQQSAACNAAHTVEARLSRWLLRARDLSGSDSVHVTQEFLSQMLGVQRTSVTIVANTFQQAGIIRYRRGNIQITDLDGLIDSARECYGTVKQHYAKKSDAGTRLECPPATSFYPLRLAEYWPPRSSPWSRGARSHRPDLHLA
jgi:hypothetical protein